jgi:dTDP-4-amino-4,6-dideoxygalactose transaminase
MKEDKIWLSPPHLTGNEINLVQKAFDNNWVSPYGSNIEEFEEKLERYFDVPDVALVNSGTAAIHLSLIVSNVQSGDEVIVPTLNFAGCINPILYQKAIPLFIDSEKDSWNIDPNIAEDVIKQKIQAGKKPKAIIGVHLFGIPCKLDELLFLGEKYDIPVIEDAADALGSRINNKPVGAIGKLGIISFNGNKIITTSGGGALISHDPELIALAKHLSNQARTLQPYYVHDTVGYNYMMSNILAGIGSAQMEVMEDRISRRREIYEIYRSQLSSCDGFEFVEDLPQSFSNRWLSTALIHPNKKSGMNRDKLFQNLVLHNIESRPVWTPMHMQPAYHNYPYFGGNVAENLFDKGICLPSGSGMSEDILQHVIDTIKKVVSGNKKEAVRA